MKDQLLDIDVQLLVLRYGRQNVLSAMARLVERTPEQLEQQLQALGRKPTASRRKESKLSLSEIAASESRDRTEIIEPLRSLAVAYENRLFLPTLRDVQRFLDRVDGSPQKLKSRAVAGRLVLRALSKLPRDELAKLAARDASGCESDFALLSRAIMGEASANKSD